MQFQRPATPALLFIIMMPSLATQIPLISLRPDPTPMRTASFSLGRHSHDRLLTQDFYRSTLDRTETKTWEDGDGLYRAHFRHFSGRRVRELGISALRSSDRRSLLLGLLATSTESKQRMTPTTDPPGLVRRVDLGLQSLRDETLMRQKKGASSNRKKASATRGVAEPGRLTRPVTGPDSKAEELVPDEPQSAPMPGTPLPPDQLDRLKEQAKSSPLPKDVGCQEDPSTKK